MSQPMIMSEPHFDTESANAPLKGGSFQLPLFFLAAATSFGVILYIWVGTQVGKPTSIPVYEATPIASPFRGKIVPEAELRTMNVPNVKEIRQLAQKAVLENSKFPKSATFVNDLFGVMPLGNKWLVSGYFDTYAETGLFQEPKRRRRMSFSVVIGRDMGQWKAEALKIDVYEPAPDHPVRQSDMGETSRVDPRNARWESPAGRDVVRRMAKEAGVSEEYMRRELNDAIDRHGAADWADKR
jgi:hypothetical protein